MARTPGRDNNSDRAAEGKPPRGRPPMGRTNISYFDPAPVLALRRRGETDEVFARRIGVRRETVSRWRHGVALYRATAENVAIRLERHPLDLWPDIAVPDEGWRRRAACAGTNGFYHLAGEGEVRRKKVAREMCDGCPVRTACLDWVLRNIEGPTDAGIWAGTTVEARKRMRRALRRKVA